MRAVLLVISLALICITSFARAEDKGELFPGETQSATLATNGQTDSYNFAGEADRAVFVSMSRENGGVNPSINLYAPDGTLEKTVAAYNGSSGVHAEISEHVLGQTGSYTIIAKDSGGDDAGEYSLSLVIIGGETTTTTTPAPDLTISGTITGDVTDVVTVYLNGAATMAVETASDGTYSFTGLESGDYFVTPVKGSVVFDPASKDIRLFGTDQVGVDFISTLPTLTVADVSVVPSQAPDDGETTVVFTADVTAEGGTVNSATLDLSAIGGSSKQPMYDDGTNGDESAGDGRYSFETTVAAGTPPGLKAVRLKAADLTGMKVEGILQLDIINIISDTIEAEGTSRYKVENEMEGQTFVVDILLIEETSAGCSVVLDILKPDGSIFQEDIPLIEDETEISIDNATTGMWTFQVRNECSEPKKYRIATAATGTGIITGMVVDAKTAKTLNQVNLSSNADGIASSIDGFYLMPHRAGTFIISTQRLG